VENIQQLIPWMPHNQTTALVSDEIQHQDLNLWRRWLM
jgi:hypothetical protein